MKGTGLSPFPGAMVDVNGVSMYERAPRRFRPVLQQKKGPSRMALNLGGFPVAWAVLDFDVFVSRPGQIGVGFRALLDRSRLASGGPLRDSLRRDPIQQFAIQFGYPPGVMASSSIP